jgi:hypothetical protein
VAEQQALHRDDRDVLAPADDDVLAPSDEADVAVGIDGRRIARPKPPVDERRSVLLGAAEITEEQTRPRSWKSPTSPGSAGSPVGRTTRISAPGAATPSVSSAPGPSAGFHDTPIAYSVIPHAGQIAQPSACPAAGGSDRGTGAPAIVIMRSESPGADAPPSTRSCTNVGAQNIAVTRWSSIAARATGVCQRSRWTDVPPR